MSCSLRQKKTIVGSWFPFLHEWDPFVLDPFEKLHEWCNAFYNFKDLALGVCTFKLMCFRI